MRTVLFVTHKPKRCGVYEFGKEVFGAISTSAKYKFVKAECDSLGELRQSIKDNTPSVIIYNYHPSVMPWICTRISKGIYRNNIANIKLLQVGIIHEVTQQVADNATAYRNKWILGRSQKKLNSLFDFYIAADPSLLLKNPLVFKTGRLAPEYNAPLSPLPAIFTVGSFGIATPEKSFERIIQKVQDEFDEAVIRLNMPPADFGDNDGTRARAVAEQCRKSIYKKGIKLEVSYDYMEKDKLLSFLAGNSMNVFIRKDTDGRGISSAIDHALAVRKPVAVSRSSMFRHILSVRPSVCVDDSSLKTIFNNGFAPLQKVAKYWDEAHLVLDYERILDSVFKSASRPVQKRRGVLGTLKFFCRKMFTLPEPYHNDKN